MACTRVGNYFESVLSTFASMVLISFDLYIRVSSYSSFICNSVCAAINDVEVLKVPLTPQFDVNVEATLAGITPKTKMVFLCSPGG